MDAYILTRTYNILVNYKSYDENLNGILIGNLNAPHYAPKSLLACLAAIHIL